MIPSLLRWVPAQYHCIDKVTLFPDELYPLLFLVLLILQPSFGSHQFETRAYYSSSTGEEVSFTSLGFNLPDDKLTAFKNHHQTSFKQNTVPIYEWNRDVDFQSTLAFHLTPKYPALLRNTTLHGINMFYTPPSYNLTLLRQTTGHDIGSPSSHKEQDLTYMKPTLAERHHPYVSAASKPSSLSQMAIPPSLHSAASPTPLPHRLSLNDLIDNDSAVPLVKLYPTSDLHPNWDYERPYNVISSPSVDAVWDYLTQHPSEKVLQHSNSTNGMHTLSDSHKRFQSAYFTSFDGPDGHVHERPTDFASLSDSLHPAPVQSHPELLSKGDNNSSQPLFTPRTQLEQLIDNVEAFIQRRVALDTSSGDAPSNQSAFLNQASLFNTVGDGSGSDVTQSELVDYILPPVNPVTDEPNPFSPLFPSDILPSSVKIHNDDITLFTGYHKATALQMIPLGHVVDHLLRRDPILTATVLRDLRFDIHSGRYDDLIAYCNSYKQNHGASSRYYGRKILQEASHAFDFMRMCNHPSKQLTRHGLDAFFTYYLTPSHEDEPFSRVSALKVPMNASSHPALWATREYINLYTRYFHVPSDSQNSRNTTTTLLRFLPIPNQVVPYSLRLNRSHRTPTPTSTDLHQPSSQHPNSDHRPGILRDSSSSPDKLLPSHPTIDIFEPTTQLLSPSLISSLFSFDKMNDYRRSTSIVEMFRDGDSLYKDRSGVGYVCENLSQMEPFRTRSDIAIGGQATSKPLQTDSMHRNLVQAHGMQRIVMLPPRAAKKLHLHSTHHPLSGYTQGAWSRLFNHYLEYTHLFTECNIEHEIISMFQQNITDGGEQEISSNIPGIQSIYAKYYPSTHRVSSAHSAKPPAPAPSTPVLPSLSSFIHIQYLTTRYIQHHSERFTRTLHLLQVISLLRTNPQFVSELAAASVPNEAENTRQSITSNGMGKSTVWMIPTLANNAPFPYVYDSYESFFHFINTCPNTRQNSTFYTFDEHTDRLRDDIDDLIRASLGSTVAHSPKLNATLTKLRGLRYTGRKPNAVYSFTPAHSQRSPEGIEKASLPQSDPLHNQPHMTPSVNGTLHLKYSTLSTKAGVTIHAQHRSTPSIGDLVEAVALDSVAAKLFQALTPSVSSQLPSICLYSPTLTYSSLVDAQISYIMEYFTLRRRQGGASIDSSKISGLAQQYLSLATDLCIGSSTDTQTTTSPVYSTVEALYDLYHFVPTVPFFTAFYPQQMHQYNRELLLTSYDISTLPLPINSLLFNFTQYHHLFPEPLLYTSPYTSSDIDAIGAQRTQHLFPHASGLSLSTDQQQLPLSAKHHSYISLDLQGSIQRQGGSSRRQSTVVFSTKISSRILNFFTDIHPIVVDLNPGDILYIPPFFFYSSTMMTPSIAFHVTCMHKESELTRDIHRQFPQLLPPSQSTRPESPPHPQAIPLTLLWMNSLSHTYTNGAGNLIGELVYSRYASQLHLFYNMNPFCPLSHVNTAMKLQEMPYVVDFLTESPIPSIPKTIPQSKRGKLQVDGTVPRSMISPHSLYYHTPCSLLLFKPRMDEMSLFLLYQAARRIMTPPSERDHIELPQLLQKHSYSFTPLHLIKGTSPFSRLCFELDQPTMALATVCGQGIKGLNVPEVKATWNQMNVDHQLHSFLTFVTSFQENTGYGSMTRIEKEALLWDHLERILLHETKDPVLTQLLFLGCFIDQLYEVHLTHGGRVIPH